MQIQKTITILKCDKCGANAGENGNVYAINGMDLCEKCLEKWEKFLGEKQQPVINKFFIDNPTLKKDFKELKEEDESIQS